MEQADIFRMEFDKFLCDVISLSNGVVSPSVLRSGEVVTPYTLNAEMASAYYTGVAIPTRLTEAEEELWATRHMKYDQRLEQRVRRINKIEWN